MNASRRPPPALAGRARSMLDEYREAEDIPADVEDRIWAVVGADDAPAPAYDPLADADEGEDLDEDEDDERPVVAGRRLGTWVGLGLAAAAVLIVAWRLGGVIAERRQAVATPDAAVMRAQTESSPKRAAAAASERSVASRRSSAEAPSPQAEPSSEQIMPEVAPTSSEAPLPRASEAPGHPSARSRRPAAKPLPSEFPDEPTSPADTLAAERALVVQAWRSLGHGDTAAALQRVEEHTRRFKNGILAPEARAVEVIARCRQGGDDQALARAFHREHPHSPLAARVDEACEADETSQKK